MGRYFIYEENMERLVKKIKRIENKCAKYNLHFHFEEVGCEYREMKQEDGTTVTAKFIEVEVEGLMKHESWEFVAKLDHFAEGNIIRQFKTDIDVPERYRHTDPVCEHCNTSRGRKFTYLVHNTETDEWKQVGSSCLAEFTSGLDAEYVAKYISLFDELINFESPARGIGYHPYYSLKTFLQYAKETVNKFGYASVATVEVEGGITTKDRTKQFYFTLELGDYDEDVKKEAEEVGFDAHRPEIEEYVDNAIAWVRSLTDEDIKNNSFLFNLKIACSEDYFEMRNAGFIVSLMPTYYRHLANIEYQERKKKELEENPSRYQGEIGKRIEFKPAKITCVCSTDTMYGYSYLYQILDEAGNVYMWSTGTVLEEDKEFNFIRGTVKSHSDYRGVQQTFLTRCRVA